MAKKTAEEREYERKLAQFKSKLAGLTIDDLDRAVEHDFMVACDEIKEEGRDAQIEYLFNAEWSAKDVHEWLSENPEDEDDEDIDILNEVAPLPGRRRVVAEA